MKILQIRLITDDGSVIPIEVPDNCDVALFQNVEKLNFELSSAVGDGCPLQKQYSTILIVPKGTNTEKISKAIDEVI